MEGLLVPHLRDKFGRIIQDVRISVTDRCNFRCGYCMPDDNVPHKPKADILTYEEIARLVRVLARMGIRKVRLTGGEPLLRRGIERLVERVVATPGVEDMALTTNAYLLASRAADLKAAGLHRLNVSMDSMDAANFARLTGRPALAAVWRGLEAATTAGFHPIKINCVVMRGKNEHEVADFAAYARRTGHTVRFIEFMPLDSERAWDRASMVSGAEVLERIQERFPLVRLSARHAAETARRYGFADGAPGEVGIIAPVTEPFCGRCNRIRITADGQVRTCLFSFIEHDLRSLLRSGADDAALAQRLVRIVGLKEPSHRINEPDFEQPERTMSCIGG